MTATQENLGKSVKAYLKLDTRRQTEGLQGLIDALDKRESLSSTDQYIYDWVILRLDWLLSLED